MLVVMIVKIVIKMMVIECVCVYVGFLKFFDVKNVFLGIVVVGKIVK